MHHHFHGITWNSWWLSCYYKEFIIKYQYYDTTWNSLSLWNRYHYNMKFTINRNSFSLGIHDDLKIIFNLILFNLEFTISQNSLSLSCYHFLFIITWNLLSLSSYHLLFIITWNPLSLSLYFLYYHDLCVILTHIRHSFHFVLRATFSTNERHECLGYHQSHQILWCRSSVLTFPT